jgi:hypothetical protein
VEINELVREAHEVAVLFGLEFVEVDKTDNTVSLKVVIDAEIVIQVYGNTQKDKLNLALVFKQRRLYGYDSEGGKYHCHPAENPEAHKMVSARKSIRAFVEESLKLLEERELL